MMYWPGLGLGFWSQAAGLGHRSIRAVDGLGTTVVTLAWVVTWL